MPLKALFLVFSAHFGCNDILMFGRSPIKWRQCPLLLSGMLIHNSNKQLVVPRETILQTCIRYRRQCFKDLGLSVQRFNKLNIQLILIKGLGHP